jgi:hypothetical protein
MGNLDPELDVAAAALRSLGGVRHRDRNDLEGLEEIYGELPIEPIPGVDS